MQKSFLDCPFLCDLLKVQPNVEQRFLMRTPPEPAAGLAFDRLLPFLPFLPVLPPLLKFAFATISSLLRSPFPDVLLRLLPPPPLHPSPLARAPPPARPLPLAACEDEGCSFVRALFGNFVLLLLVIKLGGTSLMVKSHNSSWIRPTTRAFAHLPFPLLFANISNSVAMVLISS